MIYDVRHVTSYTYETPVSSAICTLRLTPREGFGQRVLDSGIEIAPFPVSRRTRLDFFGNAVDFVTIEDAHRELRVASLSRVEVHREPQPLAELTPAWEDVRLQSSMYRGLDRRSPAHEIFPTRLAPIHGPITEYATQSFAPGRPILSAAPPGICRGEHAARRLMRSIDQPRLGTRELLVRQSTALMQLV